MKRVISVMIVSAAVMAAYYLISPSPAQAEQPIPMATAAPVDELSIFLPMLYTCESTPTAPGNTPTPVPTNSVQATATPTSTSPNATPTPTPTSTSVPPNGDANSITFPAVNPLILGTCSAEIHDRYSVVGPDGNRYRTWHPIVDPETGCVFAHEHGDEPHPNGPMPPFGYISYVNGSYGMIAAHEGYKVFTHYANGNNGWGYPETDYGGLPLDFTVAIHQGTAGAGRLTVQFHDFWFWSRDRQGRETNITAAADTGEFASLCESSSADLSRSIVCEGQPVYETWNFFVDIDGAWSSGPAFFAVTNPVTYLNDNNQLQANCSDNFGLEPCPAGQMGPKSSFFLGNIRTIHEPDWVWTNANGEEFFCTTPYGERATCGEGTVRQQVAKTNMDNSAANLLLRTDDAQGFAEHQDALWRVGVPGGN